MQKCKIINYCKLLRICANVEINVEKKKTGYTGSAKKNLVYSFRPRLFIYQRGSLLLTENV